MDFHHTWIKEESYFVRLLAWDAAYDDISRMRCVFIWFSDSGTHFNDNNSI